MSVNSKMTAIANAIRAKTGGEEKLTLDAMEAAVADVYAAGKETAKARYFSEEVTLAERKTYIDLPIRFVPDIISISTTQNTSRTTASTQMLQNIRFAPTTEILCGSFGGCTSTKSNFFSYLGTASGTAFGLLTKTENGYRIYANTDSTGKQLYYDVGKYEVLAVKCSSRTDRELLTDFVNGLSDKGGTAYILKLMQEQAFTEAEWDALIAAKPGWTFVLQ